jgi:hypothetical protein
VYELVKDKIKMDHPGSTKRKEKIGKRDIHTMSIIIDRNYMTMRLETTRNAGQEA